jgi:hypothetical protein
MQNQMQPPMSPRPTSMGNKFDRMFGISKQAPRPMPNPLGGVMGGVDFLPGYGDYPLVTLDPDLNPPTSGLPFMRMPIRRPRRLPQIIPERMPSPKPTPRFFGGGLGNIFARLPNQSARERMSPPLPRAPLPMPMPERMPTERFPMMRPGFAAGTPDGLSKREILKAQELRDKMLESRDDFRRRRNLPSAFIDLPSRDRMISDLDRMIADQGAREGISPAERKAQSLKNFLLQSNRIISDRDADLYGMGILSFEDVMRRAESARQTSLANEQRRNAIADQGRTISNMDRNLMQQEQMFFPESESLDDILEDLEKKN